MSYIGSAASCDWCRDSIYDDEYVACRKCYEALEERVADLEKEIQALQEEEK